MVLRVYVACISLYALIKIAVWHSRSSYAWTCVFAPCHLFLCPVPQCFDSIASLQFGDDEDTKRDIVGMNSSEGERVPYTSSVSTVGNVENWLGDVEAMMRGTLCDVAKEALACYPAPEHAIDRGDWFFEFPAQVCGCMCWGVRNVSPIPSSASISAILYAPRLAVHRTRGEHACPCTAGRTSPVTLVWVCPCLCSAPS